MTDTTLGRHARATTVRGAPRPRPAPDGAHPPLRGAHRSRTADLTGRVEALERALAVGGDRLPAGVRAAVGEAVAAVQARLALGVDHTLVALVGGTGSGKSSLFNAVSGLSLADVGARRPTTSEVSACVWGPGGGALLDWLGVAPDRRAERAAVPDAGDGAGPSDDGADLHGVVLLDLPDHDSVRGAHREVVDRLLPQVDALVWVVDPQKYADDALHTGYLRGLVGQEAAMVVVLNQVDTVPASVRDGLAADVARLLAEDGLTGVPVLRTSAVTGSGVAELRATLARVAAGPSTAAVRAGAEVTRAAGLLAGAVAPGERAPDGLPVATAVDALAHAAGLPATVEGVSAAVRGRARAVPPLAGVRPTATADVRTRWLRDVGDGLPAPWRAALDRRVPPVPDLHRAVDEALGGVPVVARRPAAATALTALAVLAAVAAVLLGAGAAARRLADVPVLDTAAWLAGAVPVAGALAGLALLLAAVAAVVRGRAARRRAAEVREVARAALADVVGSHLAEPTERLLAEHRAVRHLAGSAALGPDAAPAPPAARRG